MGGVGWGGWGDEERLLVFAEHTKVRDQTNTPDLKPYPLSAQPQMWRNSSFLFL